MRGSRHHEVDFMYYGRLTNQSLYKSDAVEIDEDGRKIKGQWIDISKLSESNVVPQGTYRHMLGLMHNSKGRH
jgi:hypothetical protein